VTAVPSWAVAPGDLDPTFGSGGNIIDHLTDYDYGRAVTVSLPTANLAILFTNVRRSIWPCCYS
jgi:hypothetical protein